ncbi:MAG: TadE family protein [Candidatus Sulfotelmatobacter sp.]
MKKLREIASRLACDTRGAEIAEAAAVLPLMFMVLLGIFWFGQAFSIYGAITRAAQEGARAGSVPYCVTCAGNSTLAQMETNASSAVQNALQSSRLNPTLAKYPAPSPALLSCGANPVPVACDATASSNVCIQAPVQLTKGAGATNLCGVSVSLRYPFRFWLPFTSINNQTIWISASARVRRENQ